MLLCKLYYITCFATITFIGFYFEFLILLIIIMFLVYHLCITPLVSWLITTHFILIPGYHLLLNVSFIYSALVLMTRFWCMLWFALLHDNLDIIMLMHARVVLTLQVPLYRLWVSAHSQASYPIGFRPAPLRVSWYLPRVRLDPERTLASELSRPLPRKRSALRLSGLSAPPGRCA